MLIPLDLQCVLSKFQIFLKHHVHTRGAAAPDIQSQKPGSTPSGGTLRTTETQTADTNTTVSTCGEYPYKCAMTPKLVDSNSSEEDLRVSEV